MIIESFFPGRLRVRSSLFTKQEHVDRIHDYVQTLDGIKELTPNLKTGSLTVLYDSSAITMPMLMSAKEEFERLEREAQ